MSNKAVGWAWDQATDRPIDKSILVALADYAGADGYAYPSHRQIGEMVQCSPDSVQRALKRLIARGLIRFENRSRENSKAQASNGYVVLYLGPESDRYRRLENEVAIDDDGKLRPLPQNAAGGVPQNAVGGTAPVRQGVPQLCGTMNPSLDPSLEKNAQAGACEAGASPACAERDADAPVEAADWIPGRPCVVRPGPTSAGWRKWLEAIGTVAAFDLEEKGAVGLIVSAPFPGKGSKLLGYVDAAGVAKFARAAP